MAVREYGRFAVRQSGRGSGGLGRDDQANGKRSCACVRAWVHACAAARFNAKITGATSSRSGAEGGWERTRSSSEPSAVSRGDA